MGIFEKPEPTKMKPISEIVQEEQDRQDMRAMLKEWRKKNNKCPNCGEKINPTYIECAMTSNEIRVLRSRLAKESEESRAGDWVIQTPDGSIFVVADNIFREHVSIKGFQSINREE